MRNSLYFIAIMFAATVSFIAQTVEENGKLDKQLPYFQIPDYPGEYTAESVAARLVDGLGFRYYWATEGLREEDLAFKPNEDARTTRETVEHIYGLTNVIVNATLNKPNTRREPEELSFEELRKSTLENIKTSADILRNSEAGSLEEFTVVFNRGENNSEFPYWNLINGPIADAIWHCGQVVSFRRSSGNPFNSKASLFNGKLRE